jgi:2-oxo-4-hydroxy-4-carboxy-5-ureidoimidazoline decarboxylase
VTLEQFNALDAVEAEQQLMGCCSVRRWAREVGAGRPYRSVRRLRETAAAALTDADVAEGLAGHPRIGERDTARHDDRSRVEQSRVATAAPGVLAALAEGNRAYEERFGHVYLVCAQGRSADELLEVLHRRLENDEQTERKAVREELVAITLLRLAALVGTGADR